MPDFPGFELTKRGLDLKSKCEAGATLTYTKVTVGSGSLPPGGAAFSALSDAGVVTVYNQEMGVVTDTADHNTGAVVAVSTQGAADTAEVTTITPLAASELSGGEYLLLHTPYLDYHVWFAVDGVGADPEPAGSIGIKVDVEALDSAIVVAEKMATAIDQTRTGAGDLIRIITHEMDTAITAVESLGNGTSRLTFQFSNEALGQGFQWREVCIYATDPDKGEILYSATNAGELYDSVPAYGGATAMVFNWDAVTKIGSIEDVQAIIALSSSYVTNETFSIHVQDKKAHGNTWEIKNAAYTAVAGDQLHIDTSAGAVPIALPENPAKDDCIWFNDFAKTWDVNALAINQAASGELIQGATGLDIDLKGLCFGLVFTDEETKGWVVI